ncbi:hypothetical protein [uncultured Arcticibacterium sp.]|uniref:hypothetical protein n=1 Tax=uncultured Arcticibacterium sp. TaxID=2173042 RepID=UPI0030F4E28D
MSILFEITEKPLEGQSPVSDKFVLSDSTPSNYNILRIIMGGVSVTNNDTSIISDFTTNYLGLYYSIDNSRSPEENLAEILNDSIELEDLEKFFFDRRYSIKNKEFFNRLENEFCNFLTYQSKGNYTTAFIFLYRILEVISFSFPLIYASKTYDFKHTYGKLKEIFSNNSGNTKGELGFLKSAIKVMFEDSSLLETSIDIDLNDEHEKNVKIYKAIKSVVDHKIYHTDTIENSKISICFGDVSSFIITLRNRFFHLFNRGDKNLESIEIIDPDYLFSKINEPVFTWICVVYIEINKFLLEEHVKYLR